MRAGAHHVGAGAGAVCSVTARSTAATWRPSASAVRSTCRVSTPTPARTANNYAKQHLCDVAKAIYGAGTDLAEQWAKDRRAELDAGRLRDLVAALRTQTETTPEARKCIHYVFGNRHRMRYPQFRARGLCISSGVVEAGCKQIGARLKRAGMRWTVAGANAIIALRCRLLSGRFEDFWERRAANTA